MLCFGFGSAWLAFLYVCAVIGGNPCQQPKKDCGAVTVSQPKEIIGPNFLWWWQGCQVLRTLMLQRLFSLPEFSVVIMHRIWKKDYIKLLDFFFFFLKGMAKLKYHSTLRGEVCRQWHMFQVIQGREGATVQEKQQLFSQFGQMLTHITDLWLSPRLTGS